MNRIVVTVGIIILAGLVVIGVVAYINRSSTQTNGSSTAPAGFQPLDQGSINTSSAPTPEQAAPIPYATTSTQTYVPVQQPPIVTVQQTNFYVPFIQSTQPSPSYAQQIAYQQNPPEVIVQNPEPQQPQAEAPAQTPLATSTPLVIPNFNTYVAYNGPSSTPVSTNNFTGGGVSSDDGGGSVVGGLIGAAAGCLAGLVAGPIGCIVAALLGGLSGGGILGGGIGSIIGGIATLGTGSLIGLLAGGLLGGGEQLVDIQDVRGQTISVLYEPGESQLKDNRNVSVGSTVLGTYGGITGTGNFGGRITNLTSCSCGTVAGQCMISGSETCTIQGTSRGTINLIGTN